MADMTRWCANGVPLQSEPGTTSYWYDIDEGDYEEEDKTYVVKKWL